MKSFKVGDIVKRNEDHAIPDGPKNGDVGVVVKITEINEVTVRYFNGIIIWNQNDMLTLLKRENNVNT